MARPQIEVLAKAANSMVSKYNKGAGLTALAEEFDLSIPVIRRTLVDKGVKIRKAGAPRGPRTTTTSA